MIIYSRRFTHGLFLDILQVQPSNLQLTSKSGQPSARLRNTMLFLWRTDDGPTLHVYVGWE